MPDDPLGAFLRSLQDTDLLTPRQLQTVDTDLRPRCAGVADLARELVRRGWLTAYQANEINRGRGRDLLVGEYVLLDRLSAGGMGHVFRARHRRLDRIEALKVIRDDLLDDPLAARQLLARFKRELEATARLAHPNIVRVYNAGEDRGRPFMVMEYLEGSDLDRLVKDAGPLPPVQACGYVEQVAHGLQQLHERAMVHRDIKPRNLLVTAREQQVKILDLGLVLFLRGDEQQDTVEELTRCVGVMGTRPYMAPEQAANPHDVDIRADLYSLGCTFHYLLTGAPPAAEGAAGAKPLEALRPDLPPGLAAVVRQLLAPRREDRPAEPAALAAALAPFLHRHPAAVPVAAVAAGSERGAPAAVPVAVPAEAHPTLTAVAGDTPPPADTGSTARLRPRRGAAGQRACILLAVAAVVVFSGFLGVAAGGALLYWKIRPQRAPARSADGDEAVPVPVGGAPPAGATSAARPRGPRKPDPPEPAGALGPSRLLVGHNAAVRGIAPLRDGRHLLSCSLQELILWDVAKSTPVKRYSPQEALVEEMRRGLGGAQGNGGFAGVPGNPAAPPQPGPFPNGPGIDRVNLDPPEAVAVFPDGHRALIAGPNSLVFWDLDNWKRLHSCGKMEGGTIHCCVAIAPGGRYALHGDQHDCIRFYDVDKEEEIPGAGRPGHVACFSPDGTRVLVGDPTGIVTDRLKLRLFDVQTHQKIIDFPAHAGEITAVAMSPDGRLALSAGSPGADAVLWDLNTGQEVLRFKGHARSVTSVAFSPDGARALTGGGDATVRLWDVASGKELGSFTDHAQAITGVAFSPGGRYAFSGSEDKAVGVWELPK
jgi:serine/threonine-protein kinase